MRLPIPGADAQHPLRTFPTDTASPVPPDAQTSSMKTMRERDAEWALMVRQRIEGHRVHPFFEPPAPPADDVWARRGEESQDPGGWEAA